MEINDKLDREIMDIVRKLNWEIKEVNLELRTDYFTLYNPNTFNIQILDIKKAEVYMFLIDLKDMENVNDIEMFIRKEINGVLIKQHD